MSEKIKGQSDVRSEQKSQRWLSCERKETVKVKQPVVMPHFFLNFGRTCSNTLLKRSPIIQVNPLHWRNEFLMNNAITVNKNSPTCSSFST
jgi:hypothetical protein